jgi:excisionase family DNA binding protein
MPPSDLLSALLDLVRAAAREGTAQALDQRDAPAPRSASPLVDKRALAHALGVSTATVDRLCRWGRIPYVHVGDVRRFDVETVRSALEATGPGPVKAPSTGRHADAATHVPGVRLLSRDDRHR